MSLIHFCLPGRSLELGIFPVFSALCPQRTLHTSVRQCLWRLGQGSHTILAVISILFFTEMELISQRFPRSEEETRPSWRTQVKDYVHGAAWSLRTSSGPARRWTWSQVSRGLGRDRQNASLKKGGNLRTPHSVACAKPLCLSALVNGSAGLAQQLFKLLFPSSRHFSFKQNALQMLTCTVGNNRAGEAGLQSPPDPCSSPVFVTHPPSTPTPTPLLESGSTVWHRKARLDHRQPPELFRAPSSSNMSSN